MKEQVTRKKVNLRKLFKVNNVRTRARNSLQYLIFLKSKQVSKFQVLKSEKLLLVLSI